MAERPTTTANPLDAITSSRLIGVLRSKRAARLAPVAEVLVDAGISVVEFTLTTPSALAELKRYAASCPSHACPGAGTVMSADDARRAIDAGARYLVTPCLLPEVIVVGRSLGVPVLAGGFTPTEARDAHEAGAAAVKVFPAALGGPCYLRLLRDPLPDLRLVPTGGVRLGEVPDYLAAGALAVGVGGQLTAAVFDDGDLDALWARAAQLVETIAAEVPTGG